MAALHSEAAVAVLSLKMAACDPLQTLAKPILERTKKDTRHDEAKFIDAIARNSSGIAAASDVDRRGTVVEAECRTYARR